MPDYILFMHDDASGSERAEDWEAYIGALRKLDCFQGGSAIGAGLCARRAGPRPDVTTHLTGFIRIRATDLDHARALLAGNPVFEAGGTVEIRELPRTD